MSITIPTSNVYLNKPSLEGSQFDGNVGGVGGAGAAQRTAGEFVITEGGGISVPGMPVPPNPEMEPSKDVSELGFATLDKLAKISKQVGGDVNQAYEEGKKIAESGNLPATPREQVLFDIYSLMNLMLEIAKSQRGAARELRELNLQQEVKAIRDRCEDMRDSARTGMIISVVTMSISVASSLVCGIVGYKAQSNANDIAKDINLDQINQKIDLLSAKTPSETKANLDKIEGGIPLETLSEFNTEFKDSGKVYQSEGSVNDIKSHIKSLEDDINTLNSPLKEISQKITDLESDQAFKDNGVNETNINAKFNDLSKPHEHIDAEIAKLDAEIAKYESRNESGIYKDEISNLEAVKRGLQGKSNEIKKPDPAFVSKLKEFKAACDSKASIQKKVDAASEEIASLKGELEKAQTDFVNELDKQSVSVENKLAAARSRYKALKIEGKDKAAIKQAKADVKLLEQKCAWTNAMCINKKMQYGFDASLVADMKSAEHSQGLLINQLQNNIEYRSAQLVSAKCKLIGDSIKGLMDVTARLSQGFESMKQAEAQASEAEARTKGAAREDSSELAKSAQELINTVMEFLKAFQAAEAQSVGRIMA